jgi:hypothetical protein
VLTYTHSLHPTILNDNVNQFKVGLETDKGHFTVKVKTVFARNSTYQLLLGTKYFGRHSSVTSKQINVNQALTSSQ